MTPVKRLHPSNYHSPQDILPSIDPVKTHNRNLKEQHETETNQKHNTNNSIKDKFPNNSYELPGERNLEKLPDKHHLAGGNILTH